MTARRGRTTRSELLRDSATILGAALLAVLAYQVLPTGSAGPSPAASTLAEATGLPVGSVIANAATMPRLETLGPVVNPRTGIGSSPTPVPFATLRRR